MRMLKSLLFARVQVWELSLVAVFGLVTFLAVRPHPYPEPQSAGEIDYFRTTYGPGHHTEREEEWLIRDFFKGRRNGVFVDVGANHYERYNKTYYLETNLGWSGMAVEPQAEFAEGYRLHRPRTKLFQLFVSDTSDKEAVLYVSRTAPLAASADKAFVKQFGHPDEARTVHTITLNDLLDRQGVRHPNFVSIDIELHEPYALRGFDIDRFKPDLVCIEALLPVRQAILDYFAAHAYVAVGRYLWVDRENLYFMPLTGTR